MIVMSLQACVVRHRAVVCRTVSTVRKVGLRGLGIHHDGRSSSEQKKLGQHADAEELKSIFVRNLISLSEQKKSVRSVRAERASSPGLI